MPIPQFHRTPKTRKRKSRRTPASDARADPPVQAIKLDDNCALLEASANDPALSEEEVPALLASWPSRRNES